MPRAGARFEVSDLKRAFARFREDEMIDHAAALTYFTLLSLFPALLVGVAVLGFFGQQGLVDTVGDYLRENGVPPRTVDPIVATLEGATENKDTALGALVAGLATSLYGASGAFGAAGRALNIVFRVDEGRSFVRHKAADILYTAIVLVLVLVTLALIFLGGGLASDVFALIGLGDTAAGLFRILRWPAALAVGMLVFAFVYWAAPNAKAERFVWMSPGAAIAVVLWLVASAGFFFYVASFGSYPKTYGAFAGVVILLVWLWLTNNLLLFGAQVNAVADLRRSPMPDDFQGPPFPEKKAPDEETRRKIAERAQDRIMGSALRRFERALDDETEPVKRDEDDP